MTITEIFCVFQDTIKKRATGEATAVCCHGFERHPNTPIINGCISFTDNNQCPINFVESTTGKQTNKRRPNVLPTAVLYAKYGKLTSKKVKMCSQDFINCDTSSQAIQTTSINTKYLAPSQLLGIAPLTRATTANGGVLTWREKWVTNFHWGAMVTVFTATIKHERMNMNLQLCEYVQEAKQMELRNNFNRMSFGFNWKARNLSWQGRREGVKGSKSRKR